MIDFKKFDVKEKLESNLKKEFLDVYERNLKNILFEEIEKLDGNYHNYCKMFENVL